jgi:hypothetical protein
VGLCRHGHNVRAVALRLHHDQHCVQLSYRHFERSGITSTDDRCSNNHGCADDNARANHHRGADHDSRAHHNGSAYHDRCAHHHSCAGHRSANHDGCAHHNGRAYHDSRASHRRANHDRCACHRRTNHDRCARHHCSDTPSIDLGARNSNGDACATASHVDFSAESTVIDLLAAAASEQRATRGRH